MESSFTKRSVTAISTESMIRAAEHKAEELGIAIATAIVDESGILKAFRRMDGAPLMAVGVSHRKAITAVGFGIPTGEAWHEFIKDDPILSRGVFGIENFILLGGGMPIQVQGAVIGALGVAGGHYKQDEECARAALSILT